MTRYARISVPSGIYHIISRMMRGEYLISGARERLYYLKLLGRVSKNTDASVLRWCLMSSHIHLVVRAGQEPLSRLMKPLNTGFAMWLSSRLKGSGPVFSDRFKSILDIHRGQAWTIDTLAGEHWGQAWTRYIGVRGHWGQAWTIDTLAGYLSNQSSLHSLNALIVIAPHVLPEEGESKGFAGTTVYAGAEAVCAGARSLRQDAGRTRRKRWGRRRNLFGGGCSAVGDRGRGNGHHGVSSDDIAQCRETKDVVGGTRKRLQLGRIRLGQRHLRAQRSLGDPGQGLSSAEQAAPCDPTQRCRTPGNK
jgi:REP element-mobilizing transposase RayT